MAFPFSPKFFIFQFAKVVVLLFSGVYLWFPVAFYFGKFGGFSDALMPLEVGLCIGVSILMFGWAGKTVRGLFVK